ncbi:MalY/PatB family protein [Symbioplanes lichenis]|uniref:MalY/PatB family protein n=1 Tax=Symbioplanes lichenis TaxID=1629072 RepID=UPI0027392871|nr:aminotransferase class I/II-fold pyridoxal phosphate-dependent enzyme [Actinoplanes lichenis]
MLVDSLDVLRRRRSAKWRAHPEDVLPMFVAEMDVPIAPVIADALKAAIDASDTGYADADAPEFGAAVARFAGRRWGWEVDPARVTPITDVGVGVVELLRLVARPGDTVVISPPVYPPFFEWTPEARLRLHEVPLTAGYRLDLAALEVAFAERPAAYVLANPHNPVGRVHTPEELAALVTLASEYGVTVISDEIHAPLVLPGATHTPFLSIPGAGAVGVSLISASKAFNLAGLKCAAVVEGAGLDSGVASRADASGGGGDAGASAGIGGVAGVGGAAGVGAGAGAGGGARDLAARFPPDARWRTGHFGLLATVAAFTEGDAWLDDLLTFLAERRTQLAALLAEHLPAVTWRPPEATYLAWLDCRALDLGDDPAAVFLDKGRVALEPGVDFGAQGAGFVRLNFGTSAEILEEGVLRMARALG